MIRFDNLARAFIATTLLYWMVTRAQGVAQTAGWPETSWPVAMPSDVGLDETKLWQARDYALTGEGSGMIIRHGKQVLAWGDLKRIYDLKSTTKSFGSTVLGLALLDGKVKLDDPVTKHFPGFGVPPETNAHTGWLGKITLRMLATQTAGFAKQGGFGQLLFEPGTRWHYSDGGPNWLADALTLAYGRDLNEVMFERIFDPIGIRRSDLRWRNNSYRPPILAGIPRREFGAGISANVEAMTRFGYLYLRGGRWKDRQLLPQSFVELSRQASQNTSGLPVLEPENPEDSFGDAPAHYGLLWWNNNDGRLSGVARDAYWTWGLYDSLIVVIPSLDIVVARAGKSWARTRGAGHYDVLKPFLAPICAAAGALGFDSKAPTNDLDWRALPLITDGAVDTNWCQVGWGGFVVDDGALKTDCSPKGLGLLVYKKEKFGDCQIRVIFKTEKPQSNAGVIVRLPDDVLEQVGKPGAAFVRDPRGRISPGSMKAMMESADRDEGPWFAVNRGFEVQIMHANDELHRTGAIYSLAPSSARTNQPSGVWQTMIINLEGQRIHVELNGELVSTFDALAPDPRKERKWFEPKLTARRPQHGLIGLQNHDPGDVVWFREVSVRPLPGTKRK